VKETSPFPVSFVAAFADQFGTHEMLMGRLTKLCVPADKNGEGIKHPQDHLACYKSKRAPKPISVLGLSTTDQFGQLQIKQIKGPVEVCVPAYKGLCGDGEVGPDEECDDGNTNDCDGCHTACTLNTGCGDGHICGAEVCETASSTVCRFDCSGPPICGDGATDPGELCDDGNTMDGDGCSSICLSEP
jgi:cysteine-rich repeat protein